MDAMTLVIGRTLSALFLAFMFAAAFYWVAKTPLFTPPF